MMSSLSHGPPMKCSTLTRRTPEYFFMTSSVALNCAMCISSFNAFIGSSNGPNSSGSSNVSIHSARSDPAPLVLSLRESKCRPAEGGSCTGLHMFTAVTWSSPQSGSVSDSSTNTAGALSAASVAFIPSTSPSFTSSNDPIPPIIVCFLPPISSDIPSYPGCSASDWNLWRTRSRLESVRTGSDIFPSSSLTSTMRYTPLIQCGYPVINRCIGCIVSSCLSSSSEKTRWEPMTHPSDMSAAISAPVKLCMSSCLVGGGMLNSAAHTLHL